MALTVGLLAVWPTLHLSGVFSADEGSYAVQARALARGTWDMGYPFAQADPTGTYVAFHGADVAGGRVVPYATHPLWPTALSRATEVFGEEAGLRVLGVLSVLVVAMVAWGLAGELGGDAARPWAFWMAATSPVLANAWMLWAHAPSAAAGGVMALGALRSSRGRAWMLLAVLGSVVGVLLRAEGLLWAVGVALALLLTGSGARARWLGAAIAGVAAGALAVERAWRTSILGQHHAVGPVQPPIASRSAGAAVMDRLSGLRIALVDGAFGSQPGKLLGLAVIALMVGVVLLLRRGMTGAGACALGACGVAFASRILVAPADPVPSLFVAAPVLLLAVLWRPAGRREVWMPVAAALFLGAVAASIYVDGGSFQWGGRFLSPATALVAALAAVGLQRALDATPAAGSTRRRIVPVAVAGLLLVQGAGALVVPDRVRRDTAEVVERVVDRGPLVLMTQGGQVARLDWRGWPTRCWIALPDGADAADVRAVLGVLARTGVTRVTYAGLDSELLRSAGLAVPGTSRSGVIRVPSRSIDAAVARPYRCDD